MKFKSWDYDLRPVSADPPFVKSVWAKNSAETRFETQTQSKTGLKLRLFMKPAPGVPALLGLKEVALY